SGERDFGFCARRSNVLGWCHSSFASSFLNHDNWEKIAISFTCTTMTRGESWVWLSWAKLSPNPCPSHRLIFSVSSPRGEDDETRRGWGGGRRHVGIPRSGGGVAPWGGCTGPGLWTCHGDDARSRQSGCGQPGA